MSYEGYEVKVCEKGHYSCIDVHDFDQPSKCDICDTPWVHEGSVDETNCLPYYLNFFLTEKTPAVLVDCMCTGKCRKLVKEPATYNFHKFSPQEQQNEEFLSSNRTHYITYNGDFVIGKIQLHHDPLKNDFRDNYAFFGVKPPEDGGQNVH